MKNSLKKPFPWEKLFSLPGISDNKIKNKTIKNEKNGFSLARKTVSTRVQ